MGSIPKAPKHLLTPFFCFLYSIAPLFKYLDLIDDLNDLPPEEQAFFARLWARHRINTEQLNTSGPPAMAQGGPTPTSSLVLGKFHCMVCIYLLKYFDTI